jgi:hypothetical protein
MFLVSSASISNKGHSFLSRLWRRKSGAGGVSPFSQLLHYYGVAFIMRWLFAPIVSLGLAMTVVAIVSLKGGEPMTLSHGGSEAGIGLPPSDIRHSSAFETATFALG